MKNMKIKVVALMLVLVMVLTGCGSSRTVTIKSDGSVSAKSVVTIEKDAVITALIAKGYTKSEAENFANTQAITMGAKKIQVDGKDVYQYSNTENYTKKENSYVLDDYSNGYITGDTYYDTLDMTIDPETIEEYKEFGVQAEELKNVKVTYSVVFANKIVSTNGKIDSQNPNKVTFTLDVGKSILYLRQQNQDRRLQKFKKL